MNGRIRVALWLRAIVVLTAAAAAASGCSSSSGTTVYHGSSRTGAGTFAPPPVTYSNSGSRSSHVSDDALSTRMKELATQVANSIDQAVQKPRVAVYDFITIQGEASPIGRNVAEELMMGLLATGRVTVVERTALQKALDELNFNATDAVDPEKSRQIGRMVGADVVATGTLTDYGQNVKVNARLIETETSTVMGFGSVSVKRAAFGGAAPEPPPAAVHHNGNGGNQNTGNSEWDPPTGKDPGGQPYIGGARSPHEAWNEFILGIATSDANRANAVVRPEERYMLTDPNAMAIAYAFALTSPRLGDVEYHGETASAWYYWPNGSDEVTFERINGYWFVVLGE